MTEKLLQTLVVGPLQSNCYLFGDRVAKEGIIIDPGAAAEFILAEWRKTRLTLKAIVNTHGHFDHAGANRGVHEATGAPIYVHRDDAAMFERIDSQAGLFGLRADNSPPPDRNLEDGDEIIFGGISLSVIHTPGHTRGGISLHTTGLIFTGDTLFAGSIGRTDLPGGSFGTMIDSIKKKLLTFDDETVVLPGHGPATTIGRERNYNPFLT